MRLRRIFPTYGLLIPVGSLYAAQTPLRVIAPLMISALVDPEARSPE